MYWNIIDKDRYKLLKDITDTISIPNYYMIDGTALSLQLGLRESYDFDFCVTESFNNEILLKEMQTYLIFLLNKKIYNYFFSSKKNCLKSILSNLIFFYSKLYA